MGNPVREWAMRFLRPASKPEMVAIFLRQEFARPERYGEALGAALEATGATSALINNPDLTDPNANRLRGQVLAVYRGYGTGQPSYLTGFPVSNVAWSWVALAPNEVLESRLIRYLATDELVAGSRSPRKVAGRIRRGDVQGEFADRIRDLAGQLKQGLSVDPVIVVSADGGHTRVVLEGNTRILAWALAPETLAAETEVLLGVSPAIATWDEY